jgi:predicted AAA+ superfamily ATPase
MHKNYPIQKKPKNIHEVVTCRCDTFFEDKNWQEQISLSDPFGSWLLYNIPPLLDSITKVEK